MNKICSFSTFSLGINCHCAFLMRQPLCLPHSSATLLSWSLFRRRATGHRARPDRRACRACRARKERRNSSAQSRQLVAGLLACWLVSHTINAEKAAPPRARAGRTAVVRTQKVARA